MAQGSSAPATAVQSGDLLPIGFISDLASTAKAEASGESNREPIKFRKAKPPILGEAFKSNWTDGAISWYTLPGSGVIGFDLNKLTLADFRIMRDHYQINASLSVLSFMMHQLQWTIECDDKRIQEFCTEQMTEIWTRLVRALSQAFWAGYSPNILQWENDLPGRRVILSKVKDLVPEESQVNWKLVDGWAPPGHIPPKIKVYDGIRVLGSGWPVPVENTLWYPLLAENGNMYGKKLLRPAFTSWFFSILMHLYSNRYFERFGEPTPVGRAPFDDNVDIEGKKINGRDLMLQVLMALRNRSAVVLPETKTVPNGSTQAEYDYTIEYLESQMRGADFERYLMRLDEEISLALFTPLLLLRTADVGSYNLGTQHNVVYMQMLNALAGDWKEVIDHYILTRVVNFNFGENAKRAKIKFRKLGDDRLDYVKTMLQQLLAGGRVMPDLIELGEIAGLKLEEIEVLVEDPQAPGGNSGGSGGSGGSGSSGGSGGSGGKGQSNNSSALVKSMIARLIPQVSKAFRDGRVADDFQPSLGYEKQLENLLGSSARAEHSLLQSYVSSFAGIEFSTPDEVVGSMKKGLSAKIEELCQQSGGSGASVS